MAVAPAELYKSSGFEESVLNNYWCDIEPYNAIRGRLWADSHDAWVAVVFHTPESCEMSEERMNMYQKSMNMVFHTATFTSLQVRSRFQWRHQPP